jgi:hypothetical protein
VFVTVCHFHPSLIFTGKAPTLTKLITPVKSFIVQDLESSSNVSRKPSALILKKNH